MVHTFDIPSTWEAEAVGSLYSRPAWSTEQIPVQPGYTEETLTQKKSNKQNKQANNNNKNKNGEKIARNM